MQSQTMIRVGAVLGALAVGLGAFGAHGLDFEAAGRSRETWEIAARYHMYHALGLVLCGLLADRGRSTGVSAWCFTIGTVVFACTLYGVAIGGPRWLGAITPIGGAMLIAGWVAMVFARGKTTPGNQPL